MENPNNMALIFLPGSAAVASSGSSSPRSHPSCGLLFQEEGSCYPIVRSVRQEACAMAEHFRAKDLVLLKKI